MSAPSSQLQPDPSACERIVVTPDTCGGQPRIAGTRIPVAILVRCRELGMSDERILEGYPALCQGDLAAAWHYADQAAAASAG